MPSSRLAPIVRTTCGRLMTQERPAPTHPSSSATTASPLPIWNVTLRRSSSDNILGDFPDSGPEAPTKVVKENAEQTLIPWPAQIPDRCGVSSPHVVWLFRIPRRRLSHSLVVQGEDVRRDSGLRRAVDRRRRRVPPPRATDGARFHYHPPHGLGAHGPLLSMPAMRTPSTMRRSARQSPDGGGRRLSR